MAKIIEAGENILRFDNGVEIYCDHTQECCENNYADFTQLDDIARSRDFDTDNLEIEILENQGFRFGNKPFNMHFIPCYSVQNGYYTTKLDITINGRMIGTLKCEERFR